MKWYEFDILTLSFLGTFYLSVKYQTSKIEIDADALCMTWNGTHNSGLTKGLIKWSLLKFAHGTTFKLLWHLQIH